MRLVTLYTWMSLALTALTLGAQTTAGTNTVRLLSREECVRLALEHNLNIRIARHDPIIAQALLKGSYGYYEPTLSLGGQYRYRRDEPSIDSSSTSSYLNQTLDSSLGPNLTVTNTLTGTRTANSADNSWRRTQTTSLQGAGTGISGTSPIGTLWNIGAGVDGIDQEGGRSFSQNGLDIWQQTTPFPRQGTNLILDRINSSSQLDAQNSTVGLSVTQPLLRDFWTDASRTQIQLNKKELKMSEYNLQLQIMDIVTQVEKAYFELIAARDAVKVAEKALELAQQLLAETKKKVQVGVATPLDEKQVESQVATGVATVSETRRLQALMENQLKTFITDDYGKWFGITPVPSEQLIAVPEAYDLNESWLRGIALRPDYNRMKTDVEKQGLVVKLQKNQVYPRLDFKGFVGKSWVDETQQGQSSSLGDRFDSTQVQRVISASTGSSTIQTRTDSPEYAVGLALSLPLGGNVNERARLKIAREQQKQLQENLQLLHMNVLVQVEDNLKMVKAKYEQVGAFREARVFAEAALDAEQKKYENGKSTSFFVLDFQNRLTKARADEIRALSDYNKALVDFYLSEGSTLERNQISVTYH